MKCKHVDCDEQGHTRGLCGRHYDRLRYAANRPQRGEPLSLLERCRAGLNQDCVDCGAAPLFGGKRCGDCFLLRVDARRGWEEHQFYGEAATVATYARGCRCGDCRRASADQQAIYRRARR